MKFNNTKTNNTKNVKLTRFDEADEKRIQENLFPSLTKLNNSSDVNKYQEEHQQKLDCNSEVQEEISTAIVPANSNVIDVTNNKAADKEEQPREVIHVDAEVIDEVPISTDTDEQSKEQPKDQKQNKKSKYEKRKKMKKISSTVFSVITWVFSIIMLYMCMSNIYQQVFSEDSHYGFFGVGSAIVASESMEPKINTNDLIFYKKATADDLQIGDVVIYERVDVNGQLVMIVHEVQEIKNGYLTAKGINNGMPDQPVPVSTIIGKYTGKLPGIGALLKNLSTLQVLIGLAIIIVIVWTIRIICYFRKRSKLLKKIAQADDNQDAVKYFFEF